MLEVRVEGF